MNKYITSSTFNKPTNATKLAKVPKYNMASLLIIKNNAATTIKFIIGKALYTLGITADGVRASLKKNFKVAYNPGLDNCGPNLC